MRTTFLTQLAIAAASLLFFVGASGVLADSVVGRDPAIFEIQPYLFVHGTGKLALNWRYINGGLADEPVQARVYHGNTLIASVPANNDGVSWSVDLPIPECGYPDGLSFYVPGMANASPIATIPCPGEHKAVRFSFIADAQEGPEFLEDIGKEMAQFPGSAILSDGDLVQEGAHMQEWLDYFRALNNIGQSRVTFAAIGNHEYRSDPETNYWQNFFRMKAPHAFYSAYLGDIHLMVLNTNFEEDSTLLPTQLEWIKKELAKPATWKVVMFHHSPYSIGFFDGPAAIKKEHLVLRKYFVPLFEAYRVDVVLSGHTHIYERSVKDGIQYVVAGPAGGKMGIPGAKNPYSLVTFRKRTLTNFEVNEKSLHATTLSIEGEILDDFSLFR
jgi:hypothetical protein